MSLVSGPGRGGSSALPEELQLAIEPHVKYIQSLDTVNHPRYLNPRIQAANDSISAEMNSSTTSLNTYD